jgi:hypothetical protein
MLKLLITLVFSLRLLIVFGQQYQAEDILKKADSILIAHVGEKVFKEHYKYDQHSYYSYEDKRGKTRWKTLTDNKITKRGFREIALRYIFCIHQYNAICNTTTIRLDNNLKLIGEINTEFIPEYIRNNAASNIMADTTVLSLAKTVFTKPGVKPPSLRLSYDFNRKLYIWFVDNIITESLAANGDRYGRIETVEINALTGKIIAHHPEALYGHIR